MASDNSRKLSFPFIANISDDECRKAARLLGWRLGIPEESRPKHVRAELDRIFSAFPSLEAALAQQAQPETPTRDDMLYAVVAPQPFCDDCNNLGEHGGCRSCKRKPPEDAP